MVIVIGNAKTPLDYTITFSSGYDNNVLRLSKNEFDQVSRNKNILGGAATYDSFISKVGISGKKDLLNLENKLLSLKVLSSYSNNLHFSEKKYWSGGFDLMYKWGSYKHIKYSIRHLNDFYLRHYIDRDVSSSNLEPCKFSDRDQSALLTSRISKHLWLNLGMGYLQRYYAKPFTEFDLDIIYFKGKVNHKIKNLGLISLQIKQGRAVSKSDDLPKRPSSFDRSYSNTEWYIPLKIKLNNKWFNEYGVSARMDQRFYDTESIEDALHAGRSHTDQKYDLWIRANINERVNLKFSGRYRARKTISSYEWVEDLKSFRQIQYWAKIEWDLIYDRY